MGTEEIVHEDRGNRSVREEEDDIGHEKACQGLLYAWTEWSVGSEWLEYTGRFLRRDPRTLLLTF